MYGSTRVTQRSVASQVLYGLEANQARLGRLQQQLSSGKQISRPSDDPGATASALQLRSEIALSMQWSRNADDSLGWLGAIDSTVTGMSDQTRRVRDLVLQGMSTGVSSVESREAIATEIDGLRDSLLGAANSTYLGRPLFGGTTPGSTAYDPATGAYAGDNHPVARTVGSNVQVRVDITGPEAFGSAGADLFTVLSAIATHLRTDPTQLTNDLGALDGVMSRMTTTLADVGVRYNRVDQMRTAADEHKADVMSTLAGVEDIDLPKTIMDLSLQKAAYEAALGAAAHIVQPSLLDFLR